MNQLPVVRFFRLFPGRIEGDKSGLRVGDVMLLAPNPNGDWTLRDERDLAVDLSRLYGFPVDGGSKRAGLTVVATALQSGDIAKAQIAALHLQLPEPINNRGAQETDRENLARDLIACGLLKAARTGTQSIRERVPLPIPAGLPTNPQTPAPKQLPKSTPDGHQEPLVRKSGISSSRPLVA